MGTRADFYVGRGPKAEWLGSVAWDGYPDGFPPELFRPATEGAWRAAVAGLLADRDDGTEPEDGWPWPWDNSRTTDYAYAFDGGKAYASCFGCEWFDPFDEPPEERGRGEMFPDMSKLKAVTLGPRSGVIVVSGAPRETGGKDE